MTDQVELNAKVVTELRSFNNRVADFLAYDVSDVKLDGDIINFTSHGKTLRIYGCGKTYSQVFGPDGFSLMTTSTINLVYTYKYFNSTFDYRPCSFCNGEIIYLKYQETCDVCNRIMCGKYGCYDKVTNNVCTDCEGKYIK